MRALRALLCLAIALMPALAGAHQQKVAMTTVTFKARTASVEIIHRFYTHDTEHAMSGHGGSPADIMRSETAQVRFGRYVGSRFRLVDQDGRVLPLTLVGVELEGGYTWVYQETPLPDGLETLTVENEVLMDLIPGQRNTVNVECGEALGTLQFSSRMQSAVAAIDFRACPVLNPVERTDEDRTRGDGR